MEALTAYVIPVTTLRNGRNELDFKVDWRFFQRFEESPVQQGRFEVSLLFDKYLDHWHLQFGVTGEMDTECDRCLAPISLPVSGDFELFVRFEGESQEVESAEVVNVPREITHFDVSQYLYEFIVLSVPVMKAYDCQNTATPPCDMEMLERLNAKEEQQPGNGPWDILKDMQMDQ